MILAELRDKLERGPGRSVADQIKRHLISSIEGNKLAPGERLPSVRDVSNALGIARATVSRAYRELQLQGVLKGCPGKGVYVDSPFPAHSRLQVSWSSRLREKEIVRLREQFQEAEPQCELNEIEAGGDVVGLPVDLAPTWAADLQDITQEALALYGRGERGAAAFDCLRWQGRLLMLPVDWQSVAVLLNQDIFEREGVPLPGADWDQNEMLDLARRLNRPERGYHGISICKGAGVADSFLSLIWQNGGSVFDATGTRCLLAEPEAVAAAQVMRRFRDYATPANRDTEARWGSNIADFAKGRAAMIFANSWEYVEANPSDARFRLAVRPMPRGRYRASYFSAWGLGVRRGARLDGPVRTLLKLLAGIEKWPDYLPKHPPIPLFQDLEADSEAFRVYSDAKDRGRTFLADIEPACRTKLHSMLLPLVEGTLAQILRDETPVDQLLSSLRDHANRMMEKPRHPRS